MNVCTAEMNDYCWLTAAKALPKRIARLAWFALNRLISHPWLAVFAQSPYEQRNEQRSMKMAIKSNGTFLRTTEASNRRRGSPLFENGKMEGALT
jgi:hypothetical protein